MKIPTNRGTYAPQELIDSLVTYEKSKALYVKHGMIEDVDYYWYNNSAWSKDEPLGLISAEDAIEEDKPGCAFIYMGDTIPAFTKKVVNQ